MEEALLLLEGADEAHIRLKHSAGGLAVTSGTRPGELLQGTFAGGVRIWREFLGNTLRIDLRTPWGRFWPWFFWAGRGHGLDWDIKLNADVSTALYVETGASRSELDLEEMQLVEGVFKIGVGSAQMTLPGRAGFSRVLIESGMASVMVQVPAGVAARIRPQGGCATIIVDERRFPRAGSLYCSPDYESAENKVDLILKAGISIVDIR
ncbi:MAG: hypothetical protein H5T69_02645 [Chloroflexi bacterium]|nr:hypothetical protein [Chloroflexota bacterium]